MKTDPDARVLCPQMPDDQGRRTVRRVRRRCRGAVQASPSRVGSWGFLGGEKKGGGAGDGRDSVRGQGEHLSNENIAELLVLCAQESNVSG